MKKFLFSLVGSLLLFFTAQAQTDWMKTSREEVSKKIKKDDKDTVPAVWKKGALFNVNINQGSLTNWAAGGDKFSFSIASTFNGFAFYKKGRHSWDNVLDLAYGYVNTTSLGGRKSDDRIDVTTKYGYDIGRNWYVSGLVNIRTQFSDGYLYPADTVPDRVSRFFAPAYILVSPGFDYKPNTALSVFLSPITSRFVVVMDNTLAAKGAYGVDTGRHVKTEIGAYMSVNFGKEILKNISYKTRLDLFSDYKHNPQNIDVFWTNMLVMKVNKYISANVSVDMIYDDDVRVFANSKTGVLGPRLQLKQVIGVGFSLKI
ncbi:DUF3078 domain-containing protein [Chitinophaga pendula]|uniref:DUF3078 domain-containing protein n=1 Tax=Chitinophaga TaxID=79328 RepID=UPI000BB0217B|nr:MULTISPECIES: DUF3078 domain-containing protein [Chitinophaga]ASZ09995.1 hypothetical protein CK934_02880 [Chitinophaga sp. MD30]UCJ07061.1 DUF3078 domain-containing protein [Chitinophaga pendula]